MNPNMFSPKSTMDEKMKNYKLNQKRLAANNKKLKETPKLVSSSYSKPNTGRITKKI